MVAGYFDPPSRVLTWAQAGHPPPVLVRGSQAYPLPAPAGAQQDPGREGYQATSVALAAGDLLLLYSDGQVERRARPLEAGLATLTQAAGGIGDPEQVITAVLAALGSTDPEDDTCLVALQVL